MKLENDFMSRCYHEVEISYKHKISAAFLWLQVHITIQIKVKGDANFVVTGGAVGCHIDNHWCCWDDWQNWHHYHFQFQFTL